MERRALTEEDRRLLAEFLSFIPSSLRLFGNVAVTSVGATGCLGLIVLLAAGAGLRALNVQEGRSQVVIGSILGLIAVGAMVSTVSRYSATRRKNEQTRAEIEGDLAAGVADLERYRATAALRAIMEEHREHAYFLRLEDGRVLFVGYWNPEANGQPEAITEWPADLPSYPCQEVQIARAPVSTHLLDVSFSGPTIPDVETFVHRQGLTSLQLDIGEFAPVSWEEVRKTYG